MAAVEPCEAVERVKRSGQSAVVGFGTAQQIGEVGTAWACREVDDGAQAAEASPAFGLV